MLSKKLKDLKNLEKNIEVVISTTHNETYFIELRNDDNLITILDKSGEPLKYNNLNDVYKMLRKYKINEATLLQKMPYDEMISSESEGPQTVEMKVSF
jgi:hypothetical protein